MYKHFALKQAEESLADTYRILNKIQDEALLISANAKILSALEDVQKVSEGISQQLEERR